MAIFGCRLSYVSISLSSVNITVFVSRLVFDDRISLRFFKHDAFNVAIRKGKPFLDTCVSIHATSFLETSQPPIIMYVGPIKIIIMFISIT